MRPILVLIPLLAALSLPACSAEQVSGSAKAWQQNQCSKIPDRAEYDRCMSKTNAR